MGLPHFVAECSQCAAMFRCEFNDLKFAGLHGVCLSGAAVVKPPPLVKRTQSLPKATARYRVYTLLASSFRHCAPQCALTAEVSPTKNPALCDWVHTWRGC